MREQEYKVGQDAGQGSGMVRATSETGTRSEPRQDGDTIVRGAAWTFGAKVAGGAFTAVLTIFLARKLGSAAYGVFALALSILALVNLPSDFGVAVALPRFVAERRHNLVRVRAFVADGLRLEMAFSLVAAALLAALGGVLADAYNAPELGPVLRVLALALVGQNLLFFFSGVFTAMRRQALGLVASLAESACELTASVSLVLLAGGALAAAVGRVIGYAVGATAAAVLAVRLLGGGILPRSRSTAGRARRIIRYSRTLVVIDSVYTLFTQVDALLIGALLSAGSVAFFQAPMRLIVMLQYPGYAIASAVSPRLAGSRAARPDRRSFRHSVRLIIVVMMPATVFTTVWATPIIRFTLGAGYGPAASVLRVLAPYVFLSGGAVLVSTALNYLGGARRRLPVAIATVLVNFDLDLLLIPHIGVTGAAVGSDVGYAVYVLMQLSFCLGMLGLPVRPYVITFIRCLIAAAPMAAVLAVFGTGPLPVPDALLGGVAGLATYVLALFLVRELSPRELVSMVRAVRRGLA
jgi:O-antigen/teichoic acid export membrane protein